jgi:hypothetical protein
MRTLRIAISAAVVMGLVLTLAFRDEAPIATEPTQSGAPRAPTPIGPPQLDSTQGLGCIRGGTTREEVRTIMGEPDSVAFGDWVYGRSSVTFGYGVVLDYSNAGGNLRLCP